MSQRHFNRGLKPIYFYTETDNFGKPDPYYGTEGQRTLYSETFEQFINYIIREPSLVQYDEELKAIIITKENMKVIQMAIQTELYEVLENCNIDLEDFGEVVTMDDVEIIMDHIQERSYLTFREMIREALRYQHLENATPTRALWKEWNL